MYALAQLRCLPLHLLLSCLFIFSVHLLSGGPRLNYLFHLILCILDYLVCALLLSLEQLDPVVELYNVLLDLLTAVADL